MALETPLALLGNSYYELLLLKTHIQTTLRKKGQKLTEETTS